MIFPLQSYGGEARYRVYLFALPWLSFFAAAAFAPTGAWKPALARRGTLALSSAALGVCVLFAYFGLELMNRVDSDDVAAARWFERHAPDGSLHVGVTMSRAGTRAAAPAGSRPPIALPERLTARYAAVYNRAYPGSPYVIANLEYRGHKLGVVDLPRIERTLRDYAAPHTFLTLSALQERHARLYGLLPAGSLQSLDRALRASPHFRLVYRRGSSSIFEYRPSRDSGAKAVP